MSTVDPNDKISDLFPYKGNNPKAKRLYDMMLKSLFRCDQCLMISNKKHESVEDCQLAQVSQVIES